MIEDSILTPRCAIWLRSMIHTVELFYYKFEYFGEIEEEFENALAC